jgi:glycosyltransferase involved in cell wall biosynthesis
MPDDGKLAVSIILPVLNEAEHIERCVRSLMNNRYDREKVEILVIDGGSDDDTREIVTRLSCEDERVKLIDNPRRILAAGINIGIETSRGDVLIRMDGHAEAESDFIANSIEVLREHPEAWCVGGAITTISIGVFIREW